MSGPAFHAPSCACPLCTGYQGIIPQYQGVPPGPPDYVGHGKPVLHGCVCPVGAEKTCKGALCPRRAPA